LKTKTGRILIGLLLLTFITLCLGQKDSAESWTENLNWPVYGKLNELDANTFINKEKSEISNDKFIRKVHSNFDMFFNDYSFPKRQEEG